MPKIKDISAIDDFGGSVSSLENELEILKSRFKKQKDDGVKRLKRRRPVASEMMVSNRGIQARIQKDEQQHNSTLNQNQNQNEGVEYQSPKKQLVYKNFRDSRELSGETNFYSEDRERYDSDDDVSRSNRSSSESDNDEHLSKDGKDEMIVITDEFGRTRSVRQSQVTIRLSDEDHKRRREKPENLIHGDVIQHNAFKLNEERAESIRHLENTPTPDQHFDSKWEKRDLGVGYIQLSHDKETRSRQMDNLLRFRDHTEKGQKASSISKSGKRSIIAHQRLCKIAELKVMGESQSEQIRDKN